MRTGVESRQSLCLALVGAFLAGPASAGEVAWVDWISSDATSVEGIATVDGSTIAVTYTGERGFVQTSCGTNYWVTRSGPNPYTSATVDNPPDRDTDPARRCDIIALRSATAKMLEFGEPVTNPLFAVVSLNGNGYRFDRDFTILSTGHGYWGNGTLSKRVTTNPDGSVTYDVVGTGEPHGVLQFIGTFRTVSWTSLTDEYWNGFSIAVEHLAVNVPPEITVWVRGGVPLGSGSLIDFGELDTGTSTTVELLIGNSGTGPLTLTALELAGMDADSFALGSAPPAIAAGSTVSVPLTFTASGAASSATLTIRSDDADEGELVLLLAGAARIDSDADGIYDRSDNCPTTPNSDQRDLDLDAFGDVCDDDVDGDRFGREVDCDDRDDAVHALAPFFRDDDRDGLGDASEPFCRTTPPEGYVTSGPDNCPSEANPGQEDLDGDDHGDLCDDDVDGDTHLAADDCDDRDATLFEPVTYFADADGDEHGDSGASRSDCTSSPPAGYARNHPDNCPSVANPNQADADADGVGDACEGAPAPEPGTSSGCSCRHTAPDGSPLLLLAMLLVVLLQRQTRTRIEASEV